MSHLTYAGLSDIGLKRENNEDVWAALPSHGFFAIADGMGGHKGGEVAAATLIELLCDSMRKMQSRDCTELVIELRHAIQQANRQIFQQGNSDPALTGMGTTLCCLLWNEEHVIYAHVGDSRIYRMRGGMLELLTKDHSFLTKLRAINPSSCIEESSYPYKHVITRAVGTQDRVKPEISLAVHEDEDLFLLCTDGLSDMLTTHEMQQILQASPDLPSASQKLIEEAKIKGGADNMTLLLIKAHAKNLFRQQFDHTARFSGSANSGS